MARSMGVLLVAILFWPSLFVRGNSERWKRQEKWTEEDESRRIEQIKNSERMEYQTEQSFDYGQPVAIRPPERMWCYHCASPMHSVSEDMQTAIRAFLKIRRTDYPKKAVHPECTNPRNLTSLSKQYCMHSYCQTLVLTDHDTASLFTIRGCAEEFGAINEEVLDRQGDNSCHRLHDKLDIQECICRNRKYCYPGADSKNISSRSAELALILAIFAVIIHRLM